MKRLHLHHFLRLPVGICLGICFLCCFLQTILKAQTSNVRLDSSMLARKNIEAVRIAKPPKIDGNLNEPFWKTLPVAGQFVEYTPRNGTTPTFQTEIRFAYDDMALYISAIMFDSSPDSIRKELGRRDQIEQLATDYISFDILPYNDQLNMYEFKVSPQNMQGDCKYSAVGQDYNWDAVWESATRINDSGWIAEVKIPYSALRFPEVENQVWGINMWRNLYRYQEYSTWSFVDNATNEVFRYYGTITGMRNVDAPLRLSFSPYITGYIEKDPAIKNWSYYARGGLDLKLGLNDSYTLDMMLIPDFGQVQSDDQILNLSPFEVRYDEKRQFFSEGTEMFNKCGIFYTRRVGSAPRNYYAPYDSAGSNEIITKNPEETRIINATKISGRNAKGLGIGFFNGMTTNTWGILEDTISGNSRQIMTQPFTNYNVLVFDQNLKNNSYVTLINTNYWIPDNSFAADVTGTELKLCNKKNTFSFLGRLNVSQKYQVHSKPDFGHQYVLSISKPSGKFQYTLTREETGDTYDPNDMGFLLYNNETLNHLELSYSIREPVGKILSSFNSFTTDYSTLYKPNRFKTLQFQITNSTKFVNQWVNTMTLYVQPLGFNDYYEPRIWGWVYKTTLNYGLSWQPGTDPRKMFRYQHTLEIRNNPGNDNFTCFFGIAPRLRISDRLSVTLSIDYEKDMNNYGWVDTVWATTGIPTIYFGRRDIQTINNILSARYIFNNKASLTIRARHYWSQAEYFQYYTLNSEGCLNNSTYNENANINFNAFTVDLQFIWYFAPGSELSIVWKNQIISQGDQINYNYFDDFSKTINTPQTNSFSIRVLYYLDYLLLKKAFSKKPKSDVQDF
jgi:hypothetical protein